MEFVSKKQTYEATRKLLLENAARLNDPNMEQIARDMQMDGNHSRVPELYHSFSRYVHRDPLEPRDALAVAAKFMEKNVDLQGHPETARFIEYAKIAADNPELDTEFWNRWIELLASI
jgi:hypothetical protein